MGHVVGHICPAYVGGNIAFIKDGDRIVIDAHQKTSTLSYQKKKLIEKVYGILHKKNTDWSFG